MSSVGGKARSGGLRAGGPSFLGLLGGLGRTLAPCIGAGASGGTGGPLWGCVAARGRSSRGDPWSEEEGGRRVCVALQRRSPPGLRDVVKEPDTFEDAQFVPVGEPDAAVVPKLHMTLKEMELRDFSSSDVLGVAGRLLNMDESLRDVSSRRGGH